jgi:hypothetical protein
MKLFASRRCSSRSKQESTAGMLRWRMADPSPMVLLLTFTRSGVFPGGG